MTEEQENSRLVLDTVYFTFCGVTMLLATTMIVTSVSCYLLNKPKKCIKLVDAVACIIGLGLSITISVMSPSMKVELPDQNALKYSVQMSVTYK